MKHIRCMLVLAFLAGYYYSDAQKTVDGLKFSACLNKKDLPAKFYKGKFLVLDFWATWCGPCIASFPKVSALQQQYRSNPKVVFAAITAESKGLVDTFFHRRKDMMPGVLHLVDDSGATWRYFDVSLIPHLLVFAPSGELVYSGRAEELSGSMNQLLKGKNLYKEPQQRQPVVDKWAQYQQTASFIAVTGPADTSEEQYGGSNFSSDRSSVNIKNSKTSLLDAIADAGHLTSISLKFNDSLKANQSISLYYKQVKNAFPEFDKGIFGYQYQNHILDLLEKIYSFRCEWIRKKTTAYKIVVKDKQLLDNAATLSTHGSYGSRAGAKVTLVNQTLKVVAGYMEDFLEVPAFADTVSNGYDFDLDFTTMPAFEKSLSTYGLGLEKTDGYDMKKLKVIFD